MRVLFLLFIVIPIIEMWLLITVGQHIGAIPTIGLVLLTAFIGVGLLRYQGAATLLKARSKMQAGSLPAREMADGLFFAVGGALLLTPGFVTDVVGFACLTPGIRTIIIGAFAKNISSGLFSQSKAQNQSFNYSETHHYSSSSGRASSSQVDIIEGEYVASESSDHHKKIKPDQ
ncbi:FxsA family protein [Eionea flava]